MMKKIPFFLLFCLSIQVLPAQQKVILESIRCRSSRGPVMVYWQSAEVRKVFGGNLNGFLLKYYHVPLADTSNLNIEVLVANSNFNTPLYTSKGDTANLHLYINFFSGPAGNQKTHLPICIYKFVFHRRWCRMESKH